MSVSKIWIKLCVGFPLIPGGVWCLMWAHPWKLVKTHLAHEEERWNKCFYVWIHGVRIPSHHNGCALITDGRQGSVLVTKARSHKACANVPASKIASVGSIGGSWVNNLTYDIIWATQGCIFHFIHPWAQLLLLDLSREVSQQLLDELLWLLVNQAYFVMSALLGYSLLS